MKFEFEYSNPTEKAIIDYYHLDDICVDNSIQKKNIIITFQSLYLYRDMLEGNNFPRRIEAIICKNLLTYSYTIVEGLIISLAYKIQYNCINCSKKTCLYKSESMFSEDPKTNEQKAFYNGDKYLRKIKVLYLTKQADKFYKQYRSFRNNIHLGKNTDVIDESSIYNGETVYEFINFLKKLTDHLSENFGIFLRLNCEA